MKYCLFAFVVLFTTALGAQVDDLTPPGVWSDFEFSRDQEGIVIDAVDTAGNRLYHWLDEKGIWNIEPDSNYQSIRFLKKIDGWSYFISVDDTDQSHFFRFRDGQVDALPSSGNWRAQFPVVLMSDSSLFTGLNIPGTARMKACRLDSTGLQVLDDTPYGIIAANPGDPVSRHYHSTWDTLGNRWLAYYDLDLGYVRTNIPAATVQLVSGDPGGSNHSFLVNSNDDTLYSQIYRYDGTGFNEVFVPGGPYDDMHVLYRNETTNTTLFRMIDTSGVYRLVKRKFGVWSDETFRFPDILSISTSNIAAFEQDCFLSINTTSGRTELINFQSYPAGDTFFNITPGIDTFTNIAQQSEDINYPLTLVLSRTGHEYLYDVFYGQAALLAPPMVLLNPGDSVAHHVQNERNGFYSFTYQDAQGNDQAHLYHRIAPGNVLNPVSVKSTTESFFVCSTGEAAVFEEIDSQSIRSFYVYNLDSTASLPFSVRDTFNQRFLMEQGDMCLMEVSQESVSGEDPALLYMWNVDDDKLVDITFPDYLESESSYTYLVNDVIVNHGTANPSGAKLYMIKQVGRYTNECNADIKFLRDDVFGAPNIDPDYKAKDYYFSGLVPLYMGDAQTVDMQFESGFHFEPGTHITDGMIFTIRHADCGN